ncbi:MAG: glutamine--fructose-6-phosphate transaminase (isomerizing) [Simkaniaceae bacterium]|nr:glutamine--fructose-6-phosphate transaminase (isomerizing) [Simkaniaceae bacterium]
MCGIFGYIGKGNAATPCIEGLHRLEYRGYDSSGIAGLQDGQIAIEKQIGRIVNLETSLDKNPLDLSSAIAHTRWATHGKVTKANAHPHKRKRVVVVHNGIIENHTQLRDESETFDSDTDSEVIVSLFAKSEKKTFLEMGVEVVEKLKGAFAIAVIHEDFPDTILCAAKDCPLALAYDPIEQSSYIASDVHALAKDGLQVTYLKNDQIALVTRKGISLSTNKGQKLELLTHLLDLASSIASKDDYPHYMLKEIFEQPNIVRNLISQRLDETYGRAHFPELSDLRAIKRILVLGCGTSWHAGLIAKSLLENIARIPTDVEIASEFRYTNPIIEKNTLVIAISQSGETADLLAAVKETQAKGAEVIALCNVPHSTLTRIADTTLFLEAGQEMSVASTKAFTSQLTMLTLLAIHIGRLHHLSKEDGQHILNEMRKLPRVIEEVLQKKDEIAEIAGKYAHLKDFFFLGRQLMYATGLEAALKLKEISYINANGYAAGEMKHGPIALACSTLPVVAMCGNKHTIEKLSSNLSEIHARGSPIIAFAPENLLTTQVDEIIIMPDVLDILAPLPYSVAGQLFAYAAAIACGTDIDKPRNLAKSVTVE